MASGLLVQMAIGHVRELVHRGNCVSHPMGLLDRMVAVVLDVCIEDLVDTHVGHEQPRALVLDDAHGRERSDAESNAIRLPPTVADDVATKIASCAFDLRVAPPFELQVVATDTSSDTACSKVGADDAPVDGFCAEMTAMLAHRWTKTSL